MNNNQFNRNTRMLQQQQQRQYNINNNQILNPNISLPLNSQNPLSPERIQIQQRQQQMQMLTPSINNYLLNQQQKAQNNQNLYYSNPSIAIPDNTNEQNILLNQQIPLNYLNPLQQQQLNQQQLYQKLYQKTRISSPTQYPNNLNLQQQLRLLQQSQMQLQHLQQFQNPLNQQRTSGQQLRQDFNLKQQKQPHLQFQTQPQNPLQHPPQQLQSEIYTSLNHSENNNIPNNISNSQNNINNLNNNLTDKSSQSKKNDSNKRTYLRPIFPLLKPWEVKLKNVSNIHTNHFKILEELHSSIEGSDKHRVILTCYEEKDETKMVWPFCIKNIRCNGNILNITRKTPIFGNDGHVLQTNGIDLPFDISKFIHSENNTIEIETCKLEKSPKEETINAFFHIDFIYVEEEEECKERIKNDKFKRERTLEIIKKQTIGNSIDSDDDDLIIIDSTVTISLKCPISLMRIVNPVRGIKCQHVQTFELDSFLSINYKHGKWVCPICNKRTTTADLKYDEWFSELLKKIPEDIDKVQIDEKGNYTIKNEIKEKPKTQQIIYNLDDDIEEIKVELIDKIDKNESNEVEMNISNEANSSNDKIDSNSNRENNTSSFEKQNNSNNENLIINWEKEKNEANTTSSLQQEILKMSTTNTEDYPDIGPIKFKPIFDRLMISATSLNFNDNFN